METRRSHRIVTVRMDRPHRLVLSSQTASQSLVTYEPVTYGFPEASDSQPLVTPAADGKVAPATQEQTV